MTAHQSKAPVGGFVTVLRALSGALTKRWPADGGKPAAIKPFPERFHVERRPVSGIAELHELLAQIGPDQRHAVVRGAPLPDLDLHAPIARERAFEDAPSRLLCIDIDGFQPLAADPVREPAEAVAEYVATLPAAFRGVSYSWGLSASAGHPLKPGLRAHLWFWLAEPKHGAELKAWAQAAGVVLDKSVFTPSQLVFIAPPLLPKGAADPVAQRVGFMQGSHDLVQLDTRPAAQATPVAPPQHQAARDATKRAPLSLAQIGACLGAIDPDGTGYADWIAVGQAVHHETSGSDEALALWDAWSAKGTTYRERESDDPAAKWATFGRRDGAAKDLTGGTLLHLARQAGADIAAILGAASPEDFDAIASEDDPFAAAKRLAELAPLDYDRIREATAKRLKVRVTTLDKEVERHRREAADLAEAASSPAVRFVDPEPWAQPVRGADLLDELHAAVRRFIVCEHETAVAAALWCAFTWFIDVAQVAPLAIITAPEKRCGKSTLLALLARLVRRPLPASNISPAATFRVIEKHGPTLLIDEADAFLKDNEDMRGVLNSGHTRDSAFVVRTVGEDFDPQPFSTWGAKALSGIGHLHGTLMDRAIVLELRRKLPGETVERLRHADAALFSRLAAMLARFATDHAEALRQARPALPDALNDRAQDNWEPLLAIADLAGEQWPRMARDAALKLSGMEHEAPSLAGELLADVRDAFATRRAERLGTDDLLLALFEDDTRPWATYNRGKGMSSRQLARHLESYGIRPKPMRIGAERCRGYDLADMRDAFDRYLAGNASNPRPLADLPNAQTDADSLAVEPDEALA